MRVEAGFGGFPVVEYQRESAFNAVNLLQGYPSLRMLSPLEFIHETEN